jgi:hypothetical protein
MIDNDKTVRDFIPCRRRSDNKAGLFDLINNQFYTSPIGSLTPTDANVKIIKDINVEFSSDGRLYAR